MGDLEIRIENKKLIVTQNISSEDLFAQLNHPITFTPINRSLQVAE